MRMCIGREESVPHEAPFAEECRAQVSCISGCIHDASQWGCLKQCESIIRKIRENSQRSGKNYRTKPSAKPRCCSAMEEVQEGLFKDFCFFLNILDTWKICPDSWLVLGQALGYPIWQWERQQGVPFSSGFKSRAGHLTQGHPTAKQGPPNQKRLILSHQSDGWGNLHKFCPWSQAGQRESVGQPWDTSLLKQDLNPH